MKALLLAIVLDAIVGDPNYALHPVRLMGGLITAGEKLLYPPGASGAKQFFRGFLTAFGCLAVVAAISVALLFGLEKYAPNYGWLVQGILLSQLLATRSLYDEGARILSVLKYGSLAEARQKIAYLVSRQTDQLSKRDIYKAAVETMIENTTDAIVAPLFYYSLFGFVGMAVYKMINTLDSMIAYRNARYEYFGKFAARLDDVANFVPARLAALFIVLLTLVLRGDTVNSARCFWRQRHSHSSPNAGCTEAAIGGALGIKLSGPTVYFGKLKARPYIGCGSVEIDARHLAKSLNYVIGVAVLAGALSCIALGVL